MILFVTMRPATLEIRRRLRQFDLLGIAVRHFYVAPRDFPEVRRSFWGVKLSCRVWALATSVTRLRREILTLEATDILYVNALDCLAVTVFARALSTRRHRLICQIMDVHYMLIYPGLWRGPLRCIERWLLKSLDLLIVPTAGNIRYYYRTQARYQGRAAIVHNKLPTGEAASALPLPTDNQVWTIGWIGSLRCERTLKILCHTAEVLGPRVQILMAGNDKLPEGLLARSIRPHPNVQYLGAFESQKDAARLYKSVHIACGLHFEPPGKWKWALAVRILESGALGRPSIAASEADMGRFIEDNQIGWAVAEPVEQELPRLLREMTWEDYCAKAAHVSVNPQLFIGEDQLASALALLSFPGV